MIGDDTEESWDLLIGDIATAQMSKIRESIISISVSYSTTMCTQLSIEMIDPNFEMLKSNYFIVGRDVVYRSKSFLTVDGFTVGTPDQANRLIHLFEIASIDVHAGSGTTPQITIQARTKAVQQMKRDKNPGSIQGTSSDFVYNAAVQYGLRPVIQQTTVAKKINQASGDKQADSTWDVLSNLASEAKFMLFETDGLLFFCSMDFLMGHWGVTPYENSRLTNSRNEPIPMPINVVPLIWPPIDADKREKYFYQNDTSVNTGVLTGIKDTKNYSVLIPMALPTLRRSDNDPFVVSGSANIDRINGTSLRPGMTILVGGIPTFEDIYMISDVSYNHYSTDPVSIEFSKPEREAKFIQTFAAGVGFADFGVTTQQSSLINQTRIA